MLNMTEEKFLTLLESKLAEVNPSVEELVLYYLKLKSRGNLDFYKKASDSMFAGLHSVFVEERSKRSDAEAATCQALMLVKDTELKRVGNKDKIRGLAEKITNFEFFNMTSEIKKLAEFID
jgi:hypothetical protein